MAMNKRASEPTFVHLRTHSAYSLLEGALPIAKLVDLALDDDMVALAITDTGNLFGALEFSEKLADAGIQPIIGCTLRVNFGDEVLGELGDIQPSQTPPGSSPALPIALLAKDETGYANLMKLTSAAFLDTDDDEAPHIGLDHLNAAGEGLIALTGGPNGPIDKALLDGQEDCARERLELLTAAFGDRLYVELQRHGADEERRVEPRLVQLAYDLALPLVATNEPYFAEPDDYDAHDALICIAESAYVSQDERRRLTHEHYFKSQDQMAGLFSDLPEAIENSVEIARRCAYRPATRAPILPQFVAAGDGTDPDDILAAEAGELAEQARDGLKHRMTASGPAEGQTEQTYWDRLEFELDVITRMNYPGYFLIVADFIKWAKGHDIAVGPGRGSGAGSVVAWALTITDLDPLQFGLLFERFLNPDRVSMPDFDIDFCQERRDEVIRYVQDKYGADRVAQIITFGKLQARAVLRDVGRVLHMPYGQVDRLCKLVPNNPANPVTLEEAIDGEPQLQEARDSEQVVASLLEIGQKLEGLYRHASTHAAGIVIADRPLTELVPLYRDPRSSLPATQFNMKWVEAAGLVKFDFLGLKTLTVIEKAVELVRAGGTEIDLATLSLDDTATYELLARGDTAGVFQLESTGMRDSLKKLRPDRFEDIIAMVSLYRPGPMDNIPTYINRKHGEEKVEYPHEVLEPILKETYGVIIYQEQVMQIAQVLSGYSLGEADLLRRAMGKKIKAEMAQQRSRFVGGAVEQGVDKAQAGYIFELVDKFAGYGFNKSHGAAYALLAYQTGYLKANHPVAFLAASMTLDMGNTDKLALFADEARRSGITIRPPCVMTSEVDFVPEGGAIRYSLAALKNVGRGAVESICQARAKGGPFADIDDFACRLDPRAVNKRSLEMLAAAGALDQMVPDRATAYASVERIIGAAQRARADLEAGQNDLFASGAAKTDAPVAKLDVRPQNSWTPTKRLTHEFEAVGFYLTGHPLDQYKEVFDKLGVMEWTELEQTAREAGTTTAMLAGMVVSCRVRRSKSGNKFAFAAFSDPTGQYEAVVFSDTLAAAGELMEPGKAVLLRVEAECEAETVKVRANSIEALDRVSNTVQSRLTIFVGGQTSWQDLSQSIVPGGRGELHLVVRLPEVGREVEFVLPGGYDISPDRASALRCLPGVYSVLEH